MSDQTPRPSGPHLEPPSKSAELEDTGAQETGTSTSGDEHFSDASEGHRNSDSLPPSGRSSPIPRTRVEVDNDPRHGDVPGTSAYDIMEQDAVPDEIEVVPEGSRSRSQSAADRPDRPLTPGGTPVPLTMVEKVDPNLPSYGDIPGTFAYEQRKADAVPDFITKGSESESKSPPLERASSEAGSSTTAVPGRRLSCVDTTSREETELNSPTHERDSSDSLSDSVKRVQDAPGKPAPSCNTGFRGRLTNSESQTSLSISHTQQDNPQRESTLTSSHEDHEINDYGHVGGGKTTESAPFHGDASMDDDFDDFAQGQEDADDDFGDFDDDFQEPQGPAEDVTADQSRTTTQQPLSTPPIPPLIDFDTYQSLPELTAALDDSLDRLFPASKDATSLPPVEPIHDASAIFSTERSLSLWSQLVAPPPLQPQNWVKSRIRRLFLVSLGVPVDLDEILPASKQKKLVLPSIKREGAEEWGSADVHSQSKGKTGERDTSSRNESGSTVTLSQGQAGTGQKPTRRGEPAPPPELDLLAVRRLCVTTDAALQGLTDEELRRHVKELEKVTQLASSVLEYWIKKQEGLVSEREAFEGVIENLVSHARRVRK